MDIKSVLLDFVNWNNENHSDYIPNSRVGRYILETKCEGKESQDESSNCIKPDVSQQRELLIDFIKWLRKDYEVEDVYEMYADEYLQEKSINCG